MSAAREEYGKRKAPVKYVNVTKDAAGFQQMLKHSKGDRTVPVIVEGKKVTIGYKGGG